MRAKLFLGLGSNLGDRSGNLQEAIKALQARGIQPKTLSCVYETEPVGVLKQPKFLNAVCQAATALDPYEVLAAAKEVEALMGRHTTCRGGPRTIDIDILMYDELVMETEDLVIPHPRLHQRAFVLVPLADIAPDLVHPVLKTTVRQLLDQVQGKEGVNLQGILEPDTT